MSRFHCNFTVYICSVSTHALTWGVTWSVFVARVSTRALTWASTQASTHALTLWVSWWGLRVLPQYGPRLGPDSGLDSGLKSDLGFLPLYNCKTKSNVVFCFTYCFVSNIVFCNEFALAFFLKMKQDLRNKYEAD